MPYFVLVDDRIDALFFSESHAKMYAKLLTQRRIANVEVCDVLGTVVYYCR